MACLALSLLCPLTVASHCFACAPTPVMSMAPINALKIVRSILAASLYTRRRPVGHRARGVQFRSLLPGHSMQRRSFPRHLLVTSPRPLLVTSQAYDPEHVSFTGSPVSPSPVDHAILCLNVQHWRG